MASIKHRNPVELLISLLQRVEITEEGCWEWIGGRNGNGYAEVRINGEVYLAHRYMMECLLGYKLYPNQCVLHLCNNSICIRPAHLAVGKKALNNRHAALTYYERKGMSLARIIAIRARHAAGETPLSIANRENLDYKFLANLLRGVNLDDYDEDERAVA